MQNGTQSSKSVVNLYNINRSYLILMNISSNVLSLCKCPLVALPGPWTWNMSIRFDNTVVTYGIKDPISGSFDGYARFLLNSVHHKSNRKDNQFVDI